MIATAHEFVNQKQSTVAQMIVDDVKPDLVDHFTSSAKFTSIRQEVVFCLTSQKRRMLNNEPDFLRLCEGSRYPIAAIILGGGAAGTHFWVNPDDKMIILYMTQILPFDPSSYDHQLRDIV